MLGIRRERERMLRHGTVLLGGLLTLPVALILMLPGSLHGAAPWLVLSLTAALGMQLLGLLLLIRLRSRWWVLLPTAGGLAGILLLGLLLDSGTIASRGEQAAALACAIAYLATGSIPAIAPVLVGTTRRLALLLAVSIVTILSVWWAVGSTATPIVLTMAAAWPGFAMLGVWLHLGFPSAAEAIQALGRAHRGERAATQRETSRRQGARLLHDTVLATLTLLAHSGVGVPEQALRSQAASDARLLRQLREHGPGTPPSSDAESRPSVAADAEHDVAAVRERFALLGLKVSWVGAERFALGQAAAEAFLMALAECLENVRRHSGVDEAHVTIKQDEAMVRALITDQGVGFHLDHVTAGHLGVKESMQARLREVGGNARLFSAPGSGTTVVLEVPR